MGNGNYANDPYAPGAFHHHPRRRWGDLSDHSHPRFRHPRVLCALPVSAFRAVREYQLKARSSASRRTWTRCFQLSMAVRAPRFRRFGVSRLYRVSDLNIHVHRRLLSAHAQPELGEGQAHVQIRRRLARPAERLLPEHQRRHRLVSHQGFTCANALELRRQRQRHGFDAARVAAPAAARRPSRSSGSLCTTRAIMPRTPGRPRPN